MVRYDEKSALNWPLRSVRGWFSVEMRAVSRRVEIWQSGIRLAGGESESMRELIHAFMHALTVETFRCDGSACSNEVVAQPVLWRAESPAPGKGCRT